MFSFQEFITEAIEPMQGTDRGFKEVHEFQHQGARYHAVVHFVHHGDGHYKVIARTGKVGTVDADKLGFNEKTIPKELSTKVASRIGRSVDTFRKNHDWNSLQLGGTNKNNKQVYQNYAKTLVDNSSGTLTAKYGNVRNPLGGAVTIHKVTPNPAPRLSGTHENPPHSNYDKPGKYSRYYGSRSSDSRSSGIDAPSKASKGDPWYIMKKKKFNVGDASEGSSASSALSGSSAAGL